MSEKAFDVKTRLNKAASPVTTKVTLDWAGVTPEQLIQLAKSTIVIDLQAVYRGTGVIPAEENLNVKEFLGRPRGAGGFKVTPESMAARMATMVEADFRKTLVNMAVLSAQEIDKICAKKFPKSPK